MMKQENCPLCSAASKPYCNDLQREFFRCPTCDLVFVPKHHHLSPGEEKSRYDFHQNDPNDSRYRNFLNRLFQPLEKKLSPGSCGLDFGCGPGPTLSLMLKEAGHECAIYDLHYANDPSVFTETYDFLTCSETMEHLYRPLEEFERFLRIVKPGGWIGIMTQLHDEAPVAFERWHYKDDDTHVCFFSRKTFQTLEKNYGLSVEFHANSVVLFRVSSSPHTKPGNQCFV